MINYHTVPVIILKLVKMTFQWHSACGISHNKTSFMWKYYKNITILCISKLTPHFENWRNWLPWQRSYFFKHALKLSFVKILLRVKWICPERNNVTDSFHEICLNVFNMRKGECGGGGVHLWIFLRFCLADCNKLYVIVKPIHMTLSPQGKYHLE